MDAIVVAPCDAVEAPSPMGGKAWVAPRALPGPFLLPRSCA